MNYWEVASSCLFFLAAEVKEVKYQIRRDDYEIDAVKHQNIGKLVAEDLSQNSRDVANDDGKDKHDAFAFCGAGADALVNGNRPGNAKAQDHQGF